MNKAAYFSFCCSKKKKRHTQAASCTLFTHLSQSIQTDSMTSINIPVETEQTESDAFPLEISWKNISYQITTPVQNGKICFKEYVNLSLIENSK